MYPGGIWWAWSIGSAIWLAVLTFLVLRNGTFLKNLFPGISKGTGRTGGFKERMEELLGKIGEMEEFKKKGLGCVQRLVLKRYNPYHDTGGDQSFSLACLDGRGNGVVITSLHSRSGTRVFAKPVVSGKEDKVRFSKEEEEVVSQTVLR